MIAGTLLARGPATGWADDWEGAVVALRLFWKLAPLGAALLFLWVWLYDVAGFRSWVSTLVAAHFVASIGGAG